MVECIFCKIVSREIPAKIVYEDENNVAFLDINPANKGHTLVIPKYHSVTLYEIPEDNMKALSVAIKRVALAVKESINPQGINIMQNNEKAAGQAVDHVHFHVIPRWFEDGNNLKMNTLQFTDEENKKTAKLIREAVKMPEVQKKEDKVKGILDDVDANLKELDDILR